MLSRPIIDVRNVSKRYRLGVIGPTSLKEEIPRLWNRLRRATHRDPGEIAPLPPRGEFWALRDISFTIQPGEVVGIIGSNGAGKSTLLKILSRITQQTSGEITLRGRMASLLEVGTGFHPDLTGRENVFLNGALLGMSKAYIRQKLDEIVAFAEVEQFLDTPVKRYSSGMYVRLAFAVAAHLEPEILVVDEVLAVGDAAFQRKCLTQMSTVAQHGRTVLFVSHNMASILKLATRGVWLDRGRTLADGNIDDVVRQYQQATASAVGAVNRTTAFPGRDGSGRIRFQEVEIANADGGAVISGATVVFRMKLTSDAPYRVRDLKIGIGINGNHGERLLTLLNTFCPDAFGDQSVIESGWAAECRIERFDLAPGTYAIGVYVDINNDLADRCREALQLEVQDADYYGTGVMPSSSHGVLLQPQSWRYCPPEVAAPRELAMASRISGD